MNSFFIRCPFLGFIKNLSDVLINVIAELDFCDPDYLAI